jgi:hypothetical protein
VGLAASPAGRPRRSASAGGFGGRLSSGEPGLGLFRADSTSHRRAAGFTWLDSGGRDLDNYLSPVAQRVGAHRFVAIFGRNVHGPSTIAVRVAEPVPATTEPQLTARLVGSYDKAAWKHALRDQLLENGVTPAPGGPLAFDMPSPWRRSGTGRTSGSH